MVTGDSTTINLKISLSESVSPLPRVLQDMFLFRLCFRPDGYVPGLKTESARLLPGILSGERVFRAIIYPKMQIRALEMVAIDLMSNQLHVVLDPNQPLRGDYKMKIDSGEFTLDGNLCIDSGSGCTEVAVRESLGSMFTAIVKTHRQFEFLIRGETIQLDHILNAEVFDTVEALALQVDLWDLSEGNINEVITHIFRLGGMRLCCWKAVKTDDDESMYSATEGERNSLTSFVSIDDEECRLADLVMTGKSNIELFRNMIASKTGFTKNGKIGRTDLWYLPRSSTGVPMIVIGQIMIPATISIDRIRSYVIDLETKSKWDPEFLTGKQIETTLLSDQTSRISKCWSACRSKPGISGRDLVYNAYSELSDDEWTVVCWSADLDEIPLGYLAKKASSVHVRATLILGGFYVRRENDMHRITYVNQVELGLPTWLSDPVLKKRPALLNALAQQLDS